MISTIEPQLREHLNHILAVTRDHNEGALPDALHHVFRLHGGNRDAANDCVHVATRPESLPLQAIFNDRERGVGENLAIRKNAEERNSVTREPLLEKARQRWLHIKVNLVDDRPRNLNATRGEERCVQHDLVDWSTDTALAHDDHRRIEQCSDIGVAQANNSTNARVARAFKQQQFVSLCEFNLSGDDLRAEILDHLSFNHPSCKSAWNLHWGEKGDRIGQAEHAAHQCRIFVGGGVVDRDPPLPNRFHESRIQPLRAESGEESERGGRLTAVLPCRGEEQLPCARGAGHRATPRRAARCGARLG